MGNEGGAECLVGRNEQRKVGTWRTPLLKCGNHCQKLRFNLMSELCVLKERGSW